MKNGFKLFTLFSLIIFSMKTAEISPSYDQELSNLKTEFMKIKNEIVFDNNHLHLILSKEAEKEREKRIKQAPWQLAEKETFKKFIDAFLTSLKEGTTQQFKNMPQAMDRLIKQIDKEIRNVNKP